MTQLLDLLHDDDALPAREPMTSVVPQHKPLDLALLQRVLPKLKALP